MESSITAYVTPQVRPVSRVVTTSQAIDPDWEKKIDTYTSARGERVKQRFIKSPFLLSSFYEFLGMLPKEIQDIDKHAHEGNARLVLEEIDDLIDKTIEWRMKLSHKLSTEVWKPLPSNLPAPC